jgi:hypothetical protein
MLVIDLFESYSLPRSWAGLLSVTAEELISFSRTFDTGIWRQSLLWALQEHEHTNKDTLGT